VEEVEKDIYLKSGALSAQHVLDRIETRGCHLNLIILDACRSRPSRMVRSARSAPSGFSKMEAPAGSVLAFACKPGMTAQDGHGRNGVFTSHLLKHLTSAVDVDRMLRAVAKGVYDETSKAQGAAGIPCFACQYRCSRPGSCTHTSHTHPPAAGAQIRTTITTCARTPCACVTVAARGLQWALQLSTSWRRGLHARVSSSRKRWRARCRRWKNRV
jgi:hypothetical protein